MTLASVAFNYPILKKLVYLFTLLGLPILAHSQSQRELLSASLDTTSFPSQAQYYRQRSLLDNGKYKAELFFLSGKTKMIGEYLDQGLEIEDGFFQFFYWNGALESEGSFKSGRKVGIWKRFESDGTPKPDRIYPQETLQTSSKGHIPASFPGGYSALIDFIGDNTNYPVPAKIKEIQGTVKISFNISAEGEILDISLMESAHFFLDQEAIKVVQSMPFWEPAFLGVKAVSSRFILPITFEIYDGKPSITVGMGFQ